MIETHIADSTGTPAHAISPARKDMSETSTRYVGYQKVSISIAGLRGNAKVKISAWKREKLGDQQTPLHAIDSDRNSQQNAAKLNVSYDSPSFDPQAGCLRVRAPLLPHIHIP